MVRPVVSLDETELWLLNRYLLLSNDAVSENNEKEQRSSRCIYAVVK